MVDPFGLQKLNLSPGSKSKRKETFDSHKFIEKLKEESITNVSVNEDYKKH